MTSKFPLSVVWFLAFLSGLYFVNDWQMELFVAAFLLLVVWSCFMFARHAVNGWQVPKVPMLGILGAFWLWMFLSILWSGVPYISLMGFCLSSVLPLTFFAFVLNGKDKDFDFIIRALPPVFAGLAIWALIQYYAFNVEFEGQARHPLANPNSLAALFNLALFPALGVMLTTQKRWLANAALVFAIVIFGGITATGSRGALVFGGITLIAFLALNPHVVKAHWKCLSIFLASAIVLFFATNLGELQHAQMAERMSVFAGELVAPAKDAYTLSGNRNNIWAGVWALIQDHIVLGTGIGTFFLYYPAYRIPEEITGAYLAHSDPLQYWAELGIAGFILFYALGVSILIRTLRAVSQLPKGSVERTQIWAVTAAIFVTVLHTHFTFNLYVVPILFVLGFLLAWWFKRTHEILGDSIIHYKFPDQIPTSYRSGFIVVPLIMLAALFVSFMASEYHIKQAKASAYENDMEAFTRSVNLADELSFRSNYRSHLLAVTVPISILEINHDMMPMEDQKKFFDQANYFLDQAERLNPQNSAVLYYRAYVQDHVDASLIEGMEDQEALYRRSLELDPLHVGARLALLKIYRAQGDERRFEEVLEGGLDWQYRTPQGLQIFNEAERYYILTKQPEKLTQLQKKKQALQNRLKIAERKASTSLNERLFSE
ncbi:MAG: O-antigen ligase family protein [Pseudomonadota bacterium]